METAVRAATPRLEPLEARALLTAATLNPSALITLGGSIAVPRAVDVVPLLLTRDRLTPAAATGRTILDITVTPTSGSPLVAGSYRLVNSAGHAVHVSLARSGHGLVGLANVKPGDYSLQVRGRHASTGAFDVQVRLAGDANGDGAVTQADLNQIRAALGTRTDGRVNLDPNHNGRIDRYDLALARRNLGAASQALTIDVANLTGTGASGTTDPHFANNQIYISIYGEVPSNDSPNNPSGWSYFDATGTPHSLYGPNGALATVPYFTLDQAPQGIAIPNDSVIVSGEVYIGLGAPVVLPVNSGVTGYTVTSGGSGYTTAPTVALSGGTAAVANLGNGAVTATELTNGGSGYTSAPTVTLSGGGGAGATATATVANGQVTGITITGAGSGYTSAPTISFSGGGGSGASAVGVITAEVASVNVNAGGSGYTSAPTVTIAGGGGTGATASANISGGAVTSVTITNPGSGYTAPPSVYFSGGTGATASANVSGGAVTSISAGAPGTGYATAPTVTLSGGGGTGATATAQVQVQGVSAPSPSNPTDPNQNVYWNFAEFTMNSPEAPTGPYINADLSQVDVVSYPMTMQLTSSTQSSSPVVGVYPARSNLFQQYQSFLTAQNQPLFSSLLTNTGAGNDGPFRILAPSDYTLVNPNDPISTYYNAYIGQVFNVGNTLDIQVADPGTPTAATGTATVSAGGVTAVTVTSSGSGYTFPPAVSLLGGNGGGATATAVLNASGQVTGVTITNPGAGYTSAPNVAFSPGTGTFDGVVVNQIAATGTATFNGSGGVASVQVTGEGADYTSAPTVTLSGGGGTGATAVATIGGGQVTGVTITNAGTGYTSAPTVTFSPATSSATGTATLSGNGVGAVQVTAAGVGYTVPPTVTLSGGGGTGATATATIDSTGQVTGVAITSPGIGYTSAPTVIFSPPAVVYQFTAENGTLQGTQFNVFSPLTPPSWIQPVGTSQPSWRPTWMVFANAGVFADNLNQFPTATSAQSKIQGNIENQLVSAMSRGVALEPYSTWSDSSGFYPLNATANWYAAFLHQSTVTVGGLAYGFAFDDQGGNSTDVSVTNPSAMIINVGWKQVLPTS